jgi:ribosomal protein L29
MATAKKETKPKAKPVKTKDEVVTVSAIWHKKLDLFKLKMSFLKGDEKDTTKIKTARKEIARMWTKFNSVKHGK